MGDSVRDMDDILLTTWEILLGTWTLLLGIMDDSVKVMDAFVRDKGNGVSYQDCDAGIR